MKYLDVDEDHIDEGNKMASVIVRQQSHKLQYLLKENS